MKKSIEYVGKKWNNINKFKNNKYITTKTFGRGSKDERGKKGTNQEKDADFDMRAKDDEPSEGSAIMGLAYDMGQISSQTK